LGESLERQGFRWWCSWFYRAYFTWRHKSLGLNRTAGVTPAQLRNCTPGSCSRLKRIF